MDAKQIIRYVDDGANYYLRLFGGALHMEYVDTGYYCYVKPKKGEQGVTFVFDIRLENLPIETQQEKITEIKALGMPVWLDLLASDDLRKLMFGKDIEHGKLVVDSDDEVYMALLPEEKPDYPEIPSDIRVAKVETAEQFQLWAKLTNDLLSGGYPDMHPIYHYPLSQKGLMKCYICYKNELPAAVTAIMDNKGVASLEFVATIPEMRRQGLAKTMCSKAIDDAFEYDAKIITVRAINSGAKELYESLGFKIYNFAI